MEPLEEYRAKRDFTHTPEPGGEPVSESPEQPLRFVIQKHAATALHYDFRLELDGVLLSWAVPKGPSLDTKDKRLAVHVEDHPVPYADFEGTIPKGEYGGGTVIVWDTGTWTPVGDPHAGLAKGDLKFILHGTKLNGLYVLVHMKPRPGEKREMWLLIKERDEFVRPHDEYDVIAEEPNSAVTGRSLDEVTAAAETPEPPPYDAPPDAAPAGSPAAAAATPVVSAPEVPIGDRIDLELATLVAAPPESDSWIAEVKYDGYRAVFALSDGTCPRLHAQPRRLDRPLRAHRPGDRGAPGLLGGHRWRGRRVRRERASRGSGCCSPRWDRSRSVWRSPPSTCSTSTAETCASCRW